MIGYNGAARLLLAGLVFSSVVLGYGGITFAQAPKRGGTIVEGLEADFPSLDVVRVSALTEREVALSVYDPLFEVGAKGDIVPCRMRRQRIFSSD